MLNIVKYFIFFLIFFILFINTVQLHVLINLKYGLELFLFDIFGLNLGVDITGLKERGRTPEES